MSKKPKKTKQKVVYIDDGSTVADMSGVRGGTAPRPGATSTRRPSKPGKRTRPEPATRAGQIRRTYFDAMRSMVGPMLVMIGGISVAFLLVWIILGFFA